MRELKRTKGDKKKGQRKQILVSIKDNKKPILDSIMKHSFNYLDHSMYHEGSKESDDLICKFIRNNDRIYLSSNIAGSGKSYRFLLAFDDCKSETMFVTPTNKLCSKYKKLGFQTKTLCSFLGYDKSGGKKRNMRTDGVRTELAHIKHIIVDEIFCLTLSQITSIEYLVRDNKHLKLYCTGDSNQLDPICDRGKFKQMMNDMKFLEDNLMKLFPNRIHFEQVQRCRKPDGSIDEVGVERIKRLKKEIFNTQNYFNESYVRYILRDFKTVKFNDIRTKKNICFMNDTARAVNTKLSAIYGGIKVGSQLICKRRLDVKRDEDRYVCYVNYEYEVLEVLTHDGVSTGYKLFEELEGETFNITFEQYASCFQTAWCITNHSLQGSTIDESKVTLLDVVAKSQFGLMINPKFLYVALTRCKDLNAIEICYENIRGDEECNLYHLDKKIEGHRKVDIEKGIYNEKEFITKSWVYITLNTQQFLCAENNCKMPLSLYDFDEFDTSQYSINRLSNKDKEGKDIGHNRDTCNIVCLSFNNKNSFQHRIEDEEIIFGTDEPRDDDLF